ncbi:MAG: FkbM family methyltransferase [Verrucomicrobiota bacterium]
MKSDPSGPSHPPAGNGLFQRAGAHLRDWFIARFPVRMHTRTGKVIYLWDRTQFRLYEQIYVEQVFPLRQAQAELGTDAPMIFDVGCNSGLFSLAALDVWPQATVHAFEPQAGLVARFSGVLAENQLAGRVVVNRVAVAGQNGEMTLFKNRASISASLVEAKAQRRTIVGRETIQAITLDRYAEENRITGVDVLKLDVEGAELEALAGAENILKTVKMFFVEVHPPFAEPEQIEEIGARHGLKRRREWERSGKKCLDLVFVRE